MRILIIFIVKKTNYYWYFPIDKFLAKFHSIVKISVTHTEIFILKIDLTLRILGFIFITPVDVTFILITILLTVVKSQTFFLFQ